MVFKYYRRFRSYLNSNHFALANTPYQPLNEYSLLLLAHDASECPKLYQNCINDMYNASEATSFPGCPSLGEKHANDVASEGENTN